VKATDLGVDDHGGTQAAATALSVGGTATGVFQFPSDREVFAVPVVAGRIYRLEETSATDAWFRVTTAGDPLLAWQDSPESLVFEMNNCRVQAARKHRGLADYPCKSGGLVEYRGFAETIDPRIRTSCIACPPDDHPDAWFCAWRFTLSP